VVVVHGSDGMKEPWGTWIREYATDLAGKGFAAVIPEYFIKTGSTAGPQVWKSPPTHVLAWVEAIADTSAYARALPGASISRVGLLGFSLGGHICLHLRASADALVEFFAPELKFAGGIGSAAAGSRPVQIHHGVADATVPYVEAESIASVLKKEKYELELFPYEGAGHGFAGADANNATARRSSKERTLAFFSKRL
jgi:carboxymethylenebutenolidase